MEISRFSSIEENFMPALKEAGVVVIQDFAKNHLEELRKEFELLVEEEESSWLEKRDYSTGRGVFISTIEMPDKYKIKGFLLRPLYQEITNEYFNDQQPQANKFFFAVHDIPSTEHIAQDLHFDVQRTLKFFIYLTDTSAENGAFACIPGTQKEVARRRRKYKDKINYSNRHLTRIDKPESEVVSVDGKAGDLIVFDTDVLHRAGKVSVGERKVIRSQSSKYLYSYKRSILDKVKERLKL